MTDSKENGPVYNVRLINTLPLSGGMIQAMPSRADLEQVLKINERVAAAYEVLLWHFYKTKNENDLNKAEAKQ